MDFYYKAKQFFKNGDWISAKNVLLEIVASNQQNNIDPKVYGKLGDVSSKLNQFSDAGLYYSKYITCYANYDTNNVTKQLTRTYLKYANLLQYQLQQYKQAQTMYLQCIETDKQNPELAADVYFHYAKLLASMEQFENARTYYLQCLKVDATKACVHYHFGMLLYYKLSCQANGLSHLKKCIQLKSKVSKYQLEYAVMLKNENDPKYYSESNSCFEAALILSDYQNTSILREYGKFLIQCMDQKEKGAEFMKLASMFGATHNIVTDQDNKLQHSLSATVAELECKTSVSAMLNMSNNEDDYTKLKYIIYDFDLTITFRTVYDSVQGNISHLYTMDQDDFLRIFGWRDRIRRLAKHFEGVLSKGIQIILLYVNYSNDYVDIVVETLKKAYLHQFFPAIIQIDVEHEIDAKLKYLQQLKHKFNLKYEQLLYIDDNRNMIQSVTTHSLCFTVFISEQHGLTLRDFENLENNMDIMTTNYSSFQSIVPPSFISFNGKIYYEIKAQITRSQYHESIDKLDIIQWIYHNWSNEVYQAAFLEFAEKFRCICQASAKYDMWTAKEMLIPLLEIESMDSDLNTRNAIYSTPMALVQEVEKSFKKATQGRFITAFISYGYFLIKQKRFNEAINVFEDALKMNPISIKALMGMARTLRRLGGPNNAEYYFQKAAVVAPEYDQTHFRYGTFLYDHCRYKEAQKAFQTAVDLWPFSGMNHYFLAMNLLNGFNDVAGFKYHLQECVKNEPGNKHAQYQYYKMFDQHYKSPDCGNNLKNFVLNGSKRKRCKMSPLYGSEKEFKIFWYNQLEGWLIDDAFQSYYECFKRAKMNNIMSLFSMCKATLRNIIGIGNEEHIEIIMKCVDELIIENREFKEWLGSVVANKRVLDDYLNTFIHNRLPIYSFDSFYRGISSQTKLRTILGARHDTSLRRMWDSYCSNFQDNYYF